VVWQRSAGDRRPYQCIYSEVVEAAAREDPQTKRQLELPILFDLVVLDLGMPGLGGRKAFKAILEINPQAKAIIASGYAANGSIKETLQSKAAGFVAKPFRRVDFLTAVSSVLDQG